MYQFLSRERITILLIFRPPPQKKKETSPSIWWRIDGGYTRSVFKKTANTPISIFGLSQKYLWCQTQNRQFVKFWKMTDTNQRQSIVSYCTSHKKKALKEIFSKGAGKQFFAKCSNNTFTTFWFNKNWKQINTIANLGLHSTCGSINIRSNN